MKYFFVVLAVMVLASAANADQLPIANHSFEDPAFPLEDGATWTNTYPDWNAPDTEGDAFVELIDGFSTDGVNHLGVQGGIDGEVSQGVGVSLEPNTIYTLLLDVGKRNTDFNPADGLNLAEFGLYAGEDRQGGGTLLANGQFDPSAFADQEWAPQAVSYIAGASPPAGELFISLGLADGASGRAHFDNISLASEIIPEPMSGLLALLGILGMLTIRRRR